jgi:phosphatidylinositol N-acetylglucosaminyltransferase subunit C
VLALGLCFRCFLRGAVAGTLQALREASVLVTSVVLLSPLLQSLTSTVSSDSVTALVVVALLVHLYLHDYTFSPAADVAATLSGSLSLGAAIFASVLLASRLDETHQVVGLMCFALQAFVAWPFIRRDIRAAWPTCHVVLTCALHVVTCAALARVTAVLSAVHGASTLFITFACPWWLVRCHDIKQRINGCVFSSASSRIARPFLRWKDV